MNVPASPQVTADDAPRRGGSLTIGLPADPAAIDPRYVADAEGDLVAEALFDSLTTIDADLEVAPAAAVSWRASDELRTWTFELDPAGRFHDGTPVTAAAFVRSFQAIADGAAARQSPGAHRLEDVVGYEAARERGAPLAGVAARGELTLEVRLREPVADLPRALSHPSLAPVPPSADADPVGYDAQPVGNGPFMMNEPWQRGQFIRTARFEDHPAPARLDEVVFKVFPDDPSGTRQYADLEGGAIDVAQVPPDRLAEAVESYGASPDGYSGPGVLRGTTTTIYYFGFNLDDPALQSRTLREAISLLIPRSRIVDEIMLGSRTVADALVPPGVPGHQPEACRHCRYDPAAARELVADIEATAAPEATSDADGGTATDAPAEAATEPPAAPPRRLVLRHNAGRTHQAIANEVAGELRRHLDYEVEVVSEELGAYIRRLRDGDMQMFRLGWQGDEPDMGSFLTPLFHSDSPDNLSRYRDTEVDDLLEQAARQRAEFERLFLWREAERRILDAVPVAPVMVFRHNLVVTDRVHDFHIGPSGRVDLAAVWVEPVA